MLVDSTSDYAKTLRGNFVARPVRPEISVVIPTLGRPILETCLVHIVEGSEWPAAVIVVDQGRNQAIADLLNRLNQIGIRAIYIPSAQRGRSAGINRGLEQVTSRFVAITDDDCFVAPDWLACMVARLRRDPGKIITGRVELAGDEQDEFCTVTDTTGRIHTRPQLKAHPFIGGNVGLAMREVARIGYFDEHPCLASAEDSDYGYRALRLGIPIVYDPKIPVFHYHWRDESQRFNRYREYARSQGGFYGTHLLGGDPIIALQLARALLRGPIRWVRGWIAKDRENRESGRAQTLNLLPGVIDGLRR